MIIQKQLEINKTLETSFTAMNLFKMDVTGLRNTDFISIERNDS